MSITSPFLNTSKTVTSYQGFQAIRRYLRGPLERLSQIPYAHQLGTLNSKGLRFAFAAHVCRRAPRTSWNCEYISPRSLSVTRKHPPPRSTRSFAIIHHLLGFLSSGIVLCQATALQFHDKLLNPRVPNIRTSCVHQ